MAGQASLARKLTRVFKSEKAEYWIDLLAQAGIPAGRILTLAEAFDDPQARHHEMLVEFEHPSAGHVSTTGSPIRLEGAPAMSEVLPPSLGQHTRQVLAELGVDVGTIDKMIEEGSAVST
jgi:crotonobetainyl-CoA:carnitine CoA-transferase CaiB-like acyl-CoA transferase